MAKQGEDKFYQAAKMVSYNEKNKWRKLHTCNTSLFLVASWPGSSGGVVGLEAVASSSIASPAPLPRPKSQVTWLVTNQVTWVLGTRRMVGQVKQPTTIWRAWSLDYVIAASEQGLWIRQVHPNLVTWWRWTHYPIWDYRHILFIYFAEWHMPHSVSTTDSPSFFQLVLFLAAAAASPQDLSPADAIFLVMNPGLGCGSRLHPPSWRIVCRWVSVTVCYRHMLHIICNISMLDLLLCAHNTTIMVEYIRELCDCARGEISSI